MLRKAKPPGDKKDEHLMGACLVGVWWTDAVAAFSEDCCMTRPKRVLALLLLF
jgi:hypothetical protein